MGKSADPCHTHTSVDDVFYTLRSEILSLQLRPGEKLSESEIAARFGVSRQPVRDAFNRLTHEDLLVTQPKRASVVKRFSRREIEKSRFVRSAVEEKVLRGAAEDCSLICAAQLDMALQEQNKLLEEDIPSEKRLKAFIALDCEFHRTLCEIAQAEFAFDVIMAEKTKLDRLCVLDLSKNDRIPELITDHRAIAEAIKAHDPEAAMAAGMAHLGRLDETIAHISSRNANYFETT